jgi:hypothetical protein
MSGKITGITPSSQKLQSPRGEIRRGLFVWNFRIGRRPHINATTPNAPCPGVASAPPSEPSTITQLADLRISGQAVQTRCRRLVLGPGATRRMGQEGAVTRLQQDRLRSQAEGRPYIGLVSEHDWSSLVTRWPALLKRLRITLYNGCYCHHFAARCSR